MTADPATAPAPRGTGPDAAYFCSAGYVTAFDADPGRYASRAPVVCGHYTPAANQLLAAHLGSYAGEGREDQLP
jgi:hypothetical protein